MDGDLAREIDGDSMDPQVVHDIPARTHLPMSGRGGDDLHVVPGVSLSEGEGSNLGLDAAGARQIAVRDMGNAHP